MGWDLLLSMATLCTPVRVHTTNIILPSHPIQVLATDGDADLVRILKKNIAANTKVSGPAGWVGELTPW